MCIKKTIIGYIPAVIIFAGPVSVLLLGVLFGVVHNTDFSGDFNPFGWCAFLILIFTFPIGGILNLAFLAYAFSTSEGIVNKGELLTSTITLVIQIGMIYIIPLIPWFPSCKLA